MQQNTNAITLSLKKKNVGNRLLVLYINLYMQTV